MASDRDKQLEEARRIHERAGTHAAQAARRMKLGKPKGSSSAPGSNTPPATEPKETTPAKTMTELLDNLPPNMRDVTSRHLGKTFAIVGVQPSKSKE
jgi:hypothetical protein